MIRVLVSPAAFRESFTALEVAEAIELGVRQAIPSADIVSLPISDGGPELLSVLGRVLGGRVEHLEVTGPIGVPVDARILWLDSGTAVIASADACGLHLIPPTERNPCLTHTHGVGELMAHAASAGAVSIILGLGGSGTVDGGTGMARALGFSFSDDQGQALSEGGCALARLASIAAPAKPPMTRSVGSHPEPAASVTALADVASPLLGPDGAARRFGPQKGAAADQVERLEAAMERLAECVARDLGTEVTGIPGAGAAGGLGAGLASFTGARIVPGARWVMERIGFFNALKGADLVITGEGSWDGGSPLGKGPAEVLAAAARQGCAVVLVTGLVAGEIPSKVEVLGGRGLQLTLADITSLVTEATLGR